MKKKFISIIWLTLIISCNLLATIHNINASGKIITEKQILKLSEVVAECNSNVQVATINDKTQISEEDKLPRQIKLFNHEITTYSFQEFNSDNNADMIFALIPRILDCNEESNIYVESSENQLVRMNSYLTNNSDYLKSTIKLLFKKITTYLIAQNLDTAPNLKNIIAACIQGSYGLFMPHNWEQINRFNGIGRILSIPVTTIDDLLLTTNNVNYNLNKEQTIELQQKLFEAVSKAKTAIFIPNSIARKNSGKLRLPIAIINSITINPENQSITLNLLFHKNTEENYNGFYDFIDLRKKLIANIDNTNTACECEFINYTFSLNSNENKHYYSFFNAELQPNGDIQQHEQQVINSIQSAYIENEHLLLNEARDPIQAIINNQANIESPCHHYERKCLVKLSCCDRYFACHRCHNIAYQYRDHPKKQRAKNTEYLQCLRCNHEQLCTPKTMQYCKKCNLKFADYYCYMCKHICETDKDPYHCDKCGICRVNKNNSFHCDNCGTCLNISLKDNHTCRNNSAHDECCVCLEDTFLGCQILPCSHRIHQNCAKMMIMSGIRHCPICRDSFAYKLINKVTQ